MSCDSFFFRGELSSLWSRIVRVTGRSVDRAHMSSSWESWTACFWFAETANSPGSRLIVMGCVESSCVPPSSMFLFGRKSKQKEAIYGIGIVFFYESRTGIMVIWQSEDSAKILPPLHQALDGEKTTSSVENVTQWKYVWSRWTTLSTVALPPLKRVWLARGGKIYM